LERVIVQPDIAILSRSDRQSEETILDFEPVTGGQHQLPSIRKPCPRILLLGLSIVAKYSGSCADRAEPVVAEDATA